MLGLRRELADRHVFDHAPAQRAHRLVGHGDAPVLSEVANSSSSKQDAPSRYRVAVPAARSALPRERFSPLTPMRHRRIVRVSEQYGILIQLLQLLGFDP